MASGAAMTTYAGKCVRLGLREMHALQALGKWDLHGWVRLRDSARYCMVTSENACIVDGVWDSEAAADAHTAERWHGARGMHANLEWFELLHAYCDTAYYDSTVKAHCYTDGLYRGATTCARILAEDLTPMYRHTVRVALQLEQDEGDFDAVVAADDLVPLLRNSATLEQFAAMLSADDRRFVKHALRRLEERGDAARATAVALKACRSAPDAVAPTVP